MELRLRRLAPDSAPPDKAFVIANLEDRRHTVVAVNAVAATSGLTPGMTLAHARAVYPDLTVLPAHPVEDARALDRLASWCLRYSPLTAPCPSDSIWIDATGAAHLFGGEEQMLEKIRTALVRHSLSMRAAMAQTPGAAWALAHFGPQQLTVSHSPGDLAGLPVTSLRVNIEIARALWRVGIKTVADVRRMPRATLPRRFGKDLLIRLDQALGHAPEAIEAVLPPRAKRKRIAFPEPIATHEDLKRAITLLTPPLCVDLEHTQEGARRLDLLFTRTDNRIAAIRIALARPSRNPAHFAKLLTDKIETVDPGFGIESATLTAWRVETLLPRQMDCENSLAESTADLTDLIDSLMNQVGARNVYRIASCATDIPERAARPSNPTRPSLAAWPQNLPRPVQLLTPPEPVEVVAMLPDHPPARFIWRNDVRKIKHADGPERVYGEWWHDRRDLAEVRDYFRVEDEQGERFWLYRDARLTADHTYRWYLHGVFA